MGMRVGDIIEKCGTVVAEISCKRVWIEGGRVKLDEIEGNLDFEE